MPNNRARAIGLRNVSRTVDRAGSREALTCHEEQSSEYKFWRVGKPALRWASSCRKRRAVLLDRPEVLPSDMLHLLLTYKGFETLCILHTNA